MGHSSAVLLLHLRRLDHFLKRQGLHRTAHALERESLVHFDAAHLQEMVKEGRWSAAWRYLRRFSPLWEPEGEGTNHQYTALLNSLSDNSMLEFLACRGEEGGRDAKSFFGSPSDVAFPSDDAFRNKHRDAIQRHELYRSMTSAKARASVDWDSIKLKTLEKIQELLRLRPDLERSLRMRSPKCMPTPLQIIPLGLRVSRRHPRKRVDRKPAYELAHFLLQKRLPSSQDTNHSGDSGVSSATLLHPTLAIEAEASDVSLSAANTAAGANTTAVAPGTLGGDRGLGSEAEDASKEGALGGDGNEAEDASKSKKLKLSAMLEITDADARTRLKIRKESSSPL